MSLSSRILLMSLSLLSLCCSQHALNLQEGTKSVPFFTGKQSALQAAIDADDPSAVEAAIQDGADVNGKGQYGATPLEYAVVHFRKAAFRQLLAAKANTALRSDDGENTMTLATRAYAKDHDYLVLALKAGGDPNTRQNDGEPILIRFVYDFDLDAIRMMKLNGADLDIRDRGDDPIIVTSAISGYWDVVWCLLDLGARFDYPERHYNLAGAFNNPKATPPDSPIFPYKVKCWKFLRAHGMKLPDLEGAS